METPGADHRGGTDWGGIALLICLLGFYALSIVVRFVLNPGDGLVLLVVGVSVVAFTWLLFVFYWARGQLRARAVRRILPDAVLFDVVMTRDLAIEVTMAERTLGLAAPRIWPQTYLTGAATHDALWFFGGSFRAIQRARIPADHVHSVTVKTVDFPTRTVTRHFPALVIGVDPGTQELEILPLRTTLMIVRKLTYEQLGALRRDVANTWNLTLP